MNQPAPGCSSIAWSMEWFQHRSQIAHLFVSCHKHQLPLASRSFQGVGLHQGCASFRTRLPCGAFLCRWLDNCIRVNCDSLDDSHKVRKWLRADSTGEALFHLITPELEPATWIAPKATELAAVAVAVPAYASISFRLPGIEIERFWFRFVLVRWIPSFRNL